MSDDDQREYATGLEALDDDALLTLAYSDDLDVVMLERVIREVAQRELMANDEIETLMERFVQGSMRALRGRFLALFELHWGMDGLEAIASAEFAEYVDRFTITSEAADADTDGGAPAEERVADEETDWSLDDDAEEEEADTDEEDLDDDDDELDEPDPDLNWRWPITEPPESTHRSSPHFPNDFSGLWLCGYRVGKTHGLPDAERRELLDVFFRERLPTVVSKYHGDDYGDPGSEKRLQKMANVIAANCRNFKMNDRYRFSIAIADWEADLEYLRRTYYRAGRFPWPPHEP